MLPKLQRAGKLLSGYVMGLLLNFFLMSMGSYGRLIPFATIGNLINIPIMRNSEIINGNPVFTPEGLRVGNSKTAAFTGIFLTCISRLAMAVPGMTIVPFLTNAALQRCIFCPNSPAIMPFQLFWVCLCATIATPLCCAFFKQKNSFDISSIEPPLKEQALKLSPKSTTVFYNKGL